MDATYLDAYRQIICEQTDSYEELNNLFKDVHTDGLKIFHINIRSYYKNFDDLLIVLEGINIEFDVLILSEAWLDDRKDLFVLDGYEVFCTAGNWNRNDGVVAYIRFGIPALSKQIALGEAKGLQLTFALGSNQYHILAVYRSPSMDFNLFTDGLSNFYFNPSLKSNTTYLLIGDTNVDIMPNVNSVEKHIYLDILYSFGFICGIDKPTRVTGNTETCLDHIFVKHNDYRSTLAAVFQTDITDHYAIMTKIIHTDSHKTLVTDNVTTYVDARVLDGLMAAQRWDDIVLMGDVNKCCDRFINKLEEIRLLATGTKKCNTRLKKLKPWITTSLIKNIRKRDKLSKIIKMHPHDYQLKRRYNKFRDDLSKQVRRVKIDYYKTKILQAIGNPKQFWETVNEFNGTKKQIARFPIKYFLGGSGCAGGAVEVANSFNEYYSEVGRKLAQELPPPIGSPVLDDSLFRAETMMFFEPVSEAQVAKHIVEMRGGSAPGIDNIHASTLKDNMNHLIQPLAHIINRSLTSGTFPNMFKTAKVVPIFKTHDKSSFSSYRPISLLSVISKVLEKCVKVQLQEYLEKNNILSSRQFGFRRGKNSSDALYNISKDIMDTVNNNRKCLIVFIDLAKAFDSIDRLKLYSKLEQIGVRGITLDWFKSYLQNRKQVVSINNNCSDALNVDYGVVQGSTLGPLLFLIYINNIDKLNINGRLYLFADDTAVVFEGMTWENVYERACHGLIKLKRWFDENVLTMNVDKTKCMPIALRTGSEPPVHLHVKLHTCGVVANTACRCQIIDRVTHYKYLGVILDSKLRWEDHVLTTKTRLRKLIYVFY